MNPYIKHKVSNLWRFFLEFLGLFSLSSHIQNLQFLNDLVSAILDHFEKIKVFAIVIMSFIGKVIGAYRELIYPLFNIFPFEVPGVAVDFLFTLTLTASVSKIAFSRTSIFTGQRTS